MTCQIRINDIARSCSAFRKISRILKCCGSCFSNITASLCAAGAGRTRVWISTCPFAESATRAKYSLARALES